VHPAEKILATPMENVEACTYDNRREVDFTFFIVNNINVII